MGAQSVTRRIESGDIGSSRLIIGYKSFRLVDGHSRGRSAHGCSAASGRTSGTFTVLAAGRRTAGPVALFTAGRRSRGLIPVGSRRGTHGPVSAGHGVIESLGSVGSAFQVSGATVFSSGGRPAGNRIALHISAIIHIHSQIVMNLHTVDSRNSFEHIVPAVIAVGGILSRTGVTVIPLFTRNFRPDSVSHNRTVMGQIANGKAVGFETARTGTENHRFGLEEMNRRLIYTESCGSGDSAPFLNQMGDHDPFLHRDIPLFYRLVEGVITEGFIEESPLAKLIDPGQGVLGHLFCKNFVVCIQSRLGNPVRKLIEAQSLFGFIIGERFLWRKESVRKSPDGPWRPS